MHEQHGLVGRITKGLGTQLDAVDRVELLCHTSDANRADRPAAHTLANAAGLEQVS